jgi:hypothetical protein
MEGITDVVAVAGPPRSQTRSDLGRMEEGVVDLGVALAELNVNISAWYDH